MTNKEHLDSLNEQKRQLFIDFINDVKNSGWTVIITTSYRSIAFQNNLHKKDLRNAIGGLSAHNYGFALDCNFIKGNIQLKKDTPKEAWISSGIVALIKKHGLRWGGDFKNYYDPIHTDCVTQNLTAKWFNELKGKYPTEWETKATNKMDWNFKY